MYHKLARNICFIAMVILLFPILGCWSCCSGEKQTHQEEQLNSKTIKVTFIELGSVKCVPCKMMQPIIAEIKKEYAGQVKVVFYDVWTSEGRPYGQKYGVRAIPTQVFLDKDGKEFFRHTGFFSKEEIIKVLKKQGVE
ncbi:thioredoxin family protein [bacterium]|nr:thioredoxin family protein [bacterium]